MKSSLYTNCVLTVIAASLLYLCATRVAQPPSARAADYSVAGRAERVDGRTRGIRPGSFV
jgi:hypothetical protein